MENKGRSYESSFLAAIFLLNNFHFIHKTFTKNSHMLRLLEGVYSDVQNHYEGVIQQQMHAYQRSYVMLESGTCMYMYQCVIIRGSSIYMCIAILEKFVVTKAH